MLSALSGFVVSFLTKLLLEWLGELRKSATDREAGRLASELEQALDALRRQQAMIEIAARLATRAEVLSRLEEGSA